MNAISPMSLSQVALALGIGAPVNIGPTVPVLTDMPEPFTGSDYRHAIGLGVCEPPDTHPPDPDCELLDHCALLREQQAVGGAPTEQEIDAAVKVLITWGGLRDRNFDERAIARRMLEAAFREAQG